MSSEKNIRKNYTDAKFIGNIIRNARKKANLTQAKLAEILGMSDKSIGGIENGNQFPLVKNFLHMIDILHITLDDFGINNDSQIDSTRDRLLKLVYSSSPTQAKKYLKTIEFVDEVLKL